MKRKIFALGFLMIFSALALACVKERKVDNADPKLNMELADKLETEYDTGCSASKSLSLERWTEFNTAIFTGVVKERKLLIPPIAHFNGCWVKFQIDETLKGNLEKEMWVMAIYPNYPRKDIYDIKNCYLEEGKRYFISGRYVEQSSLAKSRLPFNSRVIAGWDESLAEGHCPPLVELPDGQKIVEKTRIILKKGQ